MSVVATVKIGGRTAIVNQGRAAWQLRWEDTNEQIGDDFDDVRGLIKRIDSMVAKAKVTA